MKKLVVALVLIVVFSSRVMGGEKDESASKSKALELAENFIARNHLSATNFGASDIAKFHADFFADGRQGYLANLKLKNGFVFTVHSDGTNTAIDWFHDGTTKTYYALEDAPKEKIEAIKALNLRNKLSSTNALAVAVKFFILQGHKENDFHPPILRQSYWSGGENGRGGDLPYYEVTWYRKDVKKEDIESGTSMLPIVVIEISGIDSHMISYTKGFMPVGRDY